MILQKPRQDWQASGLSMSEIQTSLVAAAISLTTLADIFCHKKPQQGMIHEGMTQMRFDAEEAFTNPKFGMAKNITVRGAGRSARPTALAFRFARAWNGMARRTLKVTCAASADSYADRVSLVSAAETLSPDQELARFLALLSRWPR